MLSIAIPIYNFDVVELCAELSRQAVELSIEFEILCYDDYSSPEYKNYNRKVAQFQGLRYEEMEHNYGRSKIRNKLAQEARFNHILFLDCDSDVEKPDFIKKYIEHIEDAPVIYGGRSYKEKRPKPEFILRWKYGVERECLNASARQKFPFRSFMTNNFLIEKSCILQNPFNENLEGYGHEDTLFALDIKKSGFSIEHINNPLCHIGLESADEYLSKTKQGVRNLARIIKMDKLSSANKLYGTYLRLRKFRILKAFRYYAKKNESKMISNLKSGEPNLRYFDLLKLYYLSEEL